MAEFLQQLLNAAVLGCIYCLIASGLTIVYGIMGIPNFAQGALYMLGAYLTFLLAPMFADNYWVLLALIVLIMAPLGIVIEQLCFRPLRDAPHENSFVMALGILMVIEGGIILFFGAEYREVKAPWDGIVSFGEVSIKIQRLLVIAGTVLLLGALYYFLRRTKKGMSLEAMSQNKELALMIGVNVNRMSFLAFAISTGLAGIGGVLMAPVSSVYPEMGMTPLLIAFAAVIFGGMGSLAGAVLGSFLMAGAQVFSTQYISSVASDVAVFGLMIITLLFRPKGIMGGRG
jgi:branched-chain amino acid transport system permease protein